MKYFLFLFIFCQTLWGATPSGLSTTNGITTESNLAINLNEYAASQQMVESAKCRYPVLTTESEIQKYFKLKTKNELNSNFKYRGFNFINDSPTYFSILKNLIEYDFNTRHENEPAEINVARLKCTTSLCAIKTIFGESEYLKTMYLLERYNLNVSFIRFNNAKKMNLNFLNSILKTLTYIPPHLVTLNTNQKIIYGIFDPKYNHPQEAANATITLYDRFLMFPESFRPYLLFHEFAHNWSDNTKYDIDESTEWLKISGWIKIPTAFAYLWEHPLQFTKNMPKEHWISKYARANSWEDFAESVSAYRFNPLKLKKIAPLKYLFIKEKLFHNVEFLDESSCSLDTSIFVKQIENKSISALEQQITYYNTQTQNPESIKVKELILKNCSSQILNLAEQQKNSIDEFKSCFSEIMDKKIPEAYNWVFLDRIKKASRIQYTKSQYHFLMDLFSELLITNATQDLQWSNSLQSDCLNFSKTFLNIMLLNSNLSKSKFSDFYSMLKPITQKIGFNLCSQMNNSNKNALNIKTLEIALNKIFAIK